MNALPPIRPRMVLVSVACFMALSLAAGEEPPADDTMETLRATQRAFVAAADRVRPSLVRIDTIGGAQPPNVWLAGDEDDSEGGTPEPPRRRSPFVDNPGSSFQVADGPTTGVVWSADGYIVTSSFNFVREPQLISVTLHDGRRLAADLLARDQVRKIALLKIDATDLAVPEWEEPASLRVGQWAIALGLGFGGEEPSLTAGILSALTRMQGWAVQTDAKLSPANYGGPLIDLDGGIIGLCVPMAQRPGELAGVEMYDSGVGFAIPRQRLEEIVSVLANGTSVYRGWLGIQSNPEIEDAVVVARVADPSPMAAAGVQPGDVILEANGRPLHGHGHLVQALYLLPAGERVRLRMKREEREFDIEVTLARSTELGGLPEPVEPEPLPMPLPGEPPTP